MTSNGKVICHIVHSKPRLIIDPVILNVKSWNKMMFHRNAIVVLLSWVILRVIKLKNNKVTINLKGNSVRN